MKTKDEIEQLVFNAIFCIRKSPSGTYFFLLTKYHSMPRRYENSNQ